VWTASPGGETRTKEPAKRISWSVFCDYIQLFWFSYESDWFISGRYLLGLEFEQLGGGKQFLCGADISVWLNANLGLRKDRGNQSTEPYPVFNAMYEYT